MKIKLSKRQWQFIGKKAGWTKLGLEFETPADYEPLRDFTRNIKPVMVKLYNGKNISSSEKDSVMQFYLEVLARGPTSIKDRAAYLKNTMMKLKKGSLLSNDEINSIVHLYLEIAKELR